MGFYDEFGGTFWLSVATIISGAFALTIQYCLKSKCSDINICFGLFDIKRRVDLEVQTELKELEIKEHIPLKEEKEEIQRI